MANASPEPGRRVVLVADMVRGFCEEGHNLYLGPPIREAIPRIRQLLQNEKNSGSDIIFLCDTHDPDDLEFKMFPPHCIRGTEEPDVIPELQEFATEVIPKRRFSAFFETNLDQRLRELKPDKIVLVGDCTNICVLYTAAEARARDYAVEVPADCVATFDPEAHDFSLRQMQSPRHRGHRATRRRLVVTGSLFEPAANILSGDTADIYFLRTRQVIEAAGLDPVTAMEVFPSRDGILCGMQETEALLRKVIPTGSEVWALSEGDAISGREVVLRIQGPYLSYGTYETAILGILASETGWATAAAECVQAAAGVPVISFGARHVHPLAAPYMDYAAIVGGCASGSTPLGARMAGKDASGTMPHAMVICLGDTVAAAEAFDRYVEPEVSRVVLVDTFRDEPEEAVRVARALGEKLQAVRLDTPSELGGVTPALVKETRARLDKSGFPGVRIFISGGMTPERIRDFWELSVPVDGFGVGSYISSAPPNDFTADIKEIDGRPIAKRGRVPGVTSNPRLKRII